MSFFVFTIFQNIIMYEYLPILLGEKLPPYMGYKPDLHPGISHIFQSAAFRFGHTLIPPGIYRRDAKCNYKVTQTGRPAVRLCGTWWDSTVSNILQLFPLFCLFAPYFITLRYMSIISLVGEFFSSFFYFPSYFARFL